jgi:Tol biopolymer transport system component
MTKPYPPRAVLLLLALASACAHPDPCRPDVSFEERLLAHIRDDVTVKPIYKSGAETHEVEPPLPPGFYFSPDGRQVIYIAERDGKEFLVVNGREAEQFDHVSSFVWRADGREFAYMAMNGEEKFAVVGDRKGRSYDYISRLVFPCGIRKVAYAARTKEGRDSIVVGDREGREFYEMCDLFVSPDGKQLAYRAYSQSAEEYLILGDRVEGPFSGVGNPVWSSDSRRVGYVVRDNDRAYVVIDNQPGEKYDQIEYLAFSPDGKHVAYAANTGRDQETPYVETGQWFVVLDGKQGELFDRIRQLLFSPVGGRLAYIARKGDSWLVVVDDQSGPVYEPYQQIDDIVFSPDGRHLAYLAEGDKRTFLIIDGEVRGHIGRIESAGIFRTDNRKLVYSPDSSQLAYITGLDNRSVLVVGNRIRGEIYDYVFDFCFGLNADDLAYVASLGEGRQCVVIRNKEGRIFRQIGSLAFSPEAQQFHYKALDEEVNGVRLIVGTKESEPFDKIWPPVFSPDGRKVAFGACKGNELWWKVMDVR